MEILSYLLILLLAALGVPLFVVLSLFGLTAYFFADIPTAGVAIEIYRMTAAPTILAIPLFTFAGYVIAESQSPKRLLNLAQAFLGGLPGGVAIVTIFVCAFFTAFTGASGVTIIALGGLLYPILLNQKYNERFSLGLITCSGSLGLLFPPSLPVILYGLVAKVDIEKLFIAGIVPGFLIIFILSFWSIKNSPKKILKPLQKERKLWSALKGSVWELFLPVGILVSIYGGLATPSETAALTAAYVVFIECFIYKDLNFFKDLPRIISESMGLVGAILLILCCALGMTSYLVDAEVSVRVFEWMRQWIDNKYVFLTFLNLFLLIVGGLMDIFSAIVVVVPLILPIAKEFDVHPIHLAMIFLTNLEIGYMTPPVGINLFIAGSRFKRPITELYSASVPFLLLMLVALLLITYIPALSLFGI